MKRNFYRMVSLLILAILILSSAPEAASARPAVAWPSVKFNKVASGFTGITDMASAGDNSGRLFVVEQAGRIRLLQNNSVLAAPFLDISGRVLNNGERGLLGLVFPPGYSWKHYFYVYYTRLDGSNVVSRFRLTANANLANASSEQQILIMPHPTYANHNGGELAFGPDGYLYIGTGDGGGAGDPQGNAQNLGALQGKILRIDTENVTLNQPSTISPGPDFSQTGPYRAFLPYITDSIPIPSGTYTIPPANPFTRKAAARPEVWAYGLRNPWRFSFDKLTGDLYIADVGQDAYEEVDFQPAGNAGGQNYGWNIMEGMHCYKTSSCNQNGLTLPVIEYAHGSNDSTGCAIIGGDVYRGSAYPSMQGFYFYSDYCTGRLWAMVNSGGSWQSQQINQTGFMVSSFGQDDQGNLYIGDASGGNVYLITP